MIRQPLRKRSYRRFQMSPFKATTSACALRCAPLLSQAGATAASGSSAACGDRERTADLAHFGLAQRSNVLPKPALVDGLDVIQVDCGFALQTFLDA